MAGMSRRIEYSEKPRTMCTRCNRDQVEALPPNNPGSLQEWFRCADCDHMWSQRRDRSEQGDRSRPDTHFD